MKSRMALPKRGRSPWSGRDVVGWFNEEDRVSTSKKFGDGGGSEGRRQGLGGALFMFWPRRFKRGCGLRHSRYVPILEGTLRGCDWWTWRTDLREARQIAKAKQGNSKGAATAGMDKGGRGQGWAVTVVAS